MYLENCVGECKTLKLRRHEMNHFRGISVCAVRGFLEPLNCGSVSLDELKIIPNLEKIPDF